jgi:HD-GYP domain-containing protein (c-di-GMP phosphodiesterase class II)
MLSDRPYRKALTLDAVREQLLIYGGKQFDLEVVNAAIQENVLEAHKAEIELLKREGTAPEYSSDRDGQQEQRVARKQEIMKKQGTK